MQEHLLSQSPIVRQVTLEPPTLNSDVTATEIYAGNEDLNTIVEVFSRSGQCRVLIGDTDVTPTTGRPVLEGESLAINTRKRVTAIRDLGVDCDVTISVFQTV